MRRDKRDEYHRLAQQIHGNAVRRWTDLYAEPNPAERERITRRARSLSDKAQRYLRLAESENDGNPL